MLPAVINSEVSQVPGIPALTAPEPTVFNWYAVAVYPRHEKTVGQYLERRGVKFFLPLYRTMRRWKDRKKKLELVLFPGYVFVNLDLHDRLQVLESPSVVRFISFQGKPARVEDNEILALTAALNAGVRTEPHPYIREGKKVRVVRGPLAGLEGIMKRRKDRFRLVLSVDLIMRSVMLEVDESDVEPC